MKRPVPTPAPARRQWGTLLAGPLIGTSYFLVVYLAAEATCAEGLDLLGTSMLRAVIFGSTALALGATVAAAQSARRRRRAAAATDAGTDDNRRFVGSTGLVLLGFFLYFMALVAAPVVGSTLC